MRVPMIAPHFPAYVPLCADFNGELHNHTYELQYEVGLPDAIASLDAHLQSNRDKLRGFERCAVSMRSQ